MDQQHPAVPHWIQQSYFVEIIEQSIPNCKHITNFCIRPALGAGENYGSLMLRLKIDTLRKDRNGNSLSYMMKVPHENSKFSNVMSIENEFYLSVLPKLEALYKERGLDLSFAPRTYKFTESQIKEPKLADTILMDDLGQKGYKNVNRLEGLNFEQTKFVLRNLAQFHAAGAQCYRVNGPYSNQMMRDTFGSTPESLNMFKTILGSFQRFFLDNLKHYKDGDYYHAKFTKLFPKMTSRLAEMVKHVPTEFNTIIHGDCWLNNLLFKFNNQGEFDDMRYIDFQLTRFGNPSSDLLNFLITSVNIEHKLKHFDYFIYYYHAQLVEHLKVLDFEASMPTLKEVHISLLKNGLWAVISSFMALPIVLLDPTEAATTDNLMGDGASGDNFKHLLYTNMRYQMYLEQLLPWLDYRGYLEV